jgi:membrane protein
MGLIVDKESGVSLFNAYFMISKQFKKNLLVSHSKAVAFNFTLAIFPTIIFLFTLIPFLSKNLRIEEFTQDTILGYLQSAIPASMYGPIESTILDIISNKQGNLLSFGAIFALFMATNGMMALMQAFNLIYKTTDKRGFLGRQVVAFFLTVGLSFVLSGSFIVLIFGDSILEFIRNNVSLSHSVIDYLYELKAFEFVVFAILFQIAISSIYVFAPAVKNRWKFFSIGAWFATISILLVSLVFGYYINNFGSYNKVYGSIGTLIGFMIWVQAIAYLLIVGFIINAGIDEAKGKIISKKLKQDLEVI